MNYMDLYNICECKAKKGLEELKKFLNNTKDLLWTETNEKGIITIEVEYFIDDENVLTDICGVWEFLENGNFIE